MGVMFNPGQVLGRGDLDIFLQNSVGNTTNAAAITYAIYWVDPGTGNEVLIGDPSRIPVNPAVGEYYAELMIPASATVGTYRIRWTFKEMVNYPEQMVVQEFGVTVPGASLVASAPSACLTDLIQKMRVLTRDNNPDRNYSFRPPTGEGEIGCYNRVFGYIWTDEEFAEYLEMALWKWNTHPPATGFCSIDDLCQKNPAWKIALLWGALVTAAQAMTYQWIADEFDYSIGGISLSIEKSSKYESLKQNAEEQWDKLVEAKKATYLITKGVAQPRFGVGVRSAFGPATGRGVLSPQSFIGF